MRSKGLITRDRLSSGLQKLQIAHVDADRLLFDLDPRHPSGRLSRAEFLAAIRGTLVEEGKREDEEADSEARRSLKHIQARVAAALTGKPPPASAPAPKLASSKGLPGRGRRGPEEEKLLVLVRGELRGRGFRSVAEAFVFLESMPGGPLPTSSTSSDAQNAKGKGTAGAEVSGAQVLEAVRALHLVATGREGALMGALGLSLSAEPTDVTAARISYREVVSTLGWGACGMGADAWDAQGRASSRQREPPPPPSLK
ncbi:hypothetical protein T484DRAFT_1892567, partial [Baffinella frigidus]